MAQMLNIPTSTPYVWRAVVLVRLAFVEVYIMETRTKEKAGDRSPALSAVGVRY